MLSRRRVAILLAVSAASLAIYGCGGDDRRAERICPRVEILEYADRLTEFRPGPGRDVTDVAVQGRLVNFAGECEVAEGSVEIDLVVEFSLDRGPANRAGKARFAHFVAIQEFHPDPAGKRVFPVEIEFEAGRDRALFRDRVAIAIPLAGGRKARDHNVFIGFQLDRGQLDYNRSGGARRPTPAGG
ncbi:MAG: hypothetical protein OXI22_02590 [Defluviicoccus sp.]|nr:hypothetical protein [Defluviicoccus sp.]